MKNTIALVAGHSGGHIVPCLTIASQQLNKEDQCIIFSTNAPLDRQIIANSSSISKHVPLKVHPPRNWYQMPMHLIRMVGAFFQSLFHLHRAKPAKVITTGGLVAVPVCMAAWVLRIPIELYELNAVPGKAVKFLAPMATTIFVCFDKAKKYFPVAKCSRVDYPLRYRDMGIDKVNVIDELKFDKARKVLLILGGSQGSHFINRAIAQLLIEHPELDAQLQIIHQTGASDQTDYAAQYHKLNIPAHVFAYHDNLAPFYGVADLVIARAGAGTIFETLHFKTPCILIPLETQATDHQVDNAQAIAAEYPEQFIMVRQNEIEGDSGKLMKIINHLL